MIFGFLTLNFKTGFADNYNRCESMNDLTNHIGNIANSGSYKPPTSNHTERSGLGDRRDISKTSSKYILENNKIVFERYDRYGKLISRVPWATHSISERA